MTESYRDFGRRWFEQLWNQGRRETIGEMMAPDIVIHDGEMVTRGPDAFYQFFDRMAGTFSDIHCDVDDTILEGDKLCVRWSCTARHTGPGLGAPPTNKKLHITGISVIRIAGSRIVEAWQNWDMLGMVEQIKGLDTSPTYIAGAPVTATR